MVEYSGSPTADRRRLYTRQSAESLTRVTFTPVVVVLFDADMVSDWLTVSIISDPRGLTSLFARLNTESCVSYLPTFEVTY